MWIMPQNHITNKYVPDICTRCEVKQIMHIYKPKMVTIYVLYMYAVCGMNYIHDILICICMHKLPLKKLSIFLSDYMNVSQFEVKC